MVTINGEQYSCAGQTLARWLEIQGYTSGRIAVEKNGDIVPRTQYAETVLADGDTLEVVRFVGGG